MLSPAARPYIDASVPVLREHGLAITKHFYAQMFAAHPELKNVFNLGNQASGAQQHSLAAAVLAYAANIDNAGALAPVLDRIAHKHAAVGITPSQYPIVGRHLLGAIQHVLGDAATPELLAAWDEAYWLLAGELIAAEARLYERAHTRPGNLTPLSVTSVRRESADTASYTLQTAEGGSPGRFAPGQYVSVAVDLPEEGLRQLRQYSLSDAPNATHWRITVKAEPAGAQTPAGRISNYLQAHVREGDTLLVSPAFGNFTPLQTTPSPRPLVLLSAGVGITPMMSVLQTLAADPSARPVLFAHAAVDPAHQLFRDDLAAARGRLPGLTTRLFYEQGAESADDVRAGRMELSADLLAPFREADVYLCGPLPFMREQWQTLLGLGFGMNRLHREVFGPELLDHLL